jgi:hypothetical protein
MIARDVMTRDVVSVTPDTPRFPSRTASARFR